MARLVVSNWPAVPSFHLIKPKYGKIQHQAWSPCQYRNRIVDLGRKPVQMPILSNS